MTAVSLGIFGVLTVTLVAFADGLTVDLTEKRSRKLRSLPVAPSADFAGRFLAGLAIAAVSYVVVVPVVGSFVLFSLVGVSIAVLVTWFVEDTDVVLRITTAGLLVSYFLTGFNGVSPSLLPERTRSRQRRAELARGGTADVAHGRGERVERCLVDEQHVDTDEDGEPPERAFPRRG